AGRPEQGRVAEDGEQSDQSTMAPADDADSCGIDFRISGSEHADSGHHVVPLGAAVVDRVVEPRPVADAAAVLRCDDDIAAGRRVADERDVVLVKMSADVLMNPDE